LESAITATVKIWPDTYFCGEQVSHSIHHIEC
jgi:hypothetical protein